MPCAVNDWCRETPALQSLQVLPDALVAPRSRDLPTTKDKGAYPGYLNTFWVHMGLAVRARIHGFIGVQMPFHREEALRGPVPKETPGDFKPVCNGWVALDLHSSPRGDRLSMCPVLPCAAVPRRFCLLLCACGLLILLWPLFVDSGKGLLAEEIRASVPLRLVDAMES
jgi:hypothetical protein